MFNLANWGMSPIQDPQSRVGTSVWINDNPEWSNNDYNAIEYNEYNAIEKEG